MGLFGKKKESKVYDINGYLSLIGTDDEQAFASMKKAAEDGDVAAQFHLGRMYEAGIGTLPSPEYASEWYSEAFSEDCIKAGLYLARLHVHGVDPTNDENTALEALATIFERCDNSLFEGSGNILFDIGSTLYYGKGSFSATMIGVEVLEKGAEIGDAQCIEFLSRVGLRKDD
jgi:hypothetical protein